jgi:hypothetical protein
MLNQGLALTPPELVVAHLKIDPKFFRRFTQGNIFPRCHTLTERAQEPRRRIVDLSVRAFFLQSFFPCG